MATKKDLVEAYSFSRRRLVTAFVSGAPGGREVEPARPARVVVGGVALGVLLLAGAAILGVFKPHSSYDASKAGLYSDDHGALYVNLGEDATPEGEESLHQVINATSAQLILGPGYTVEKASAISGEEKGSPLGILNAPATVPDADQLINSGWTACTGTGLGIRADIASGSHATTTGEAYVVHDADGDHVIATVVHGDRQQTYAYDMTTGGGALRTKLDLPLADPIQVSSAWTALFPQGAALDRTGLNVPGLGSRAPASVARQFGGAKVRIGDYFTSNGQTLVVTRSGFSPASPFAKAVLQGIGAGRDLGKEPSGQWQPSGSVGSPDWPTQLPAASTYADGDQVCALLQDNGDGTSSVRVATDPDDQASAVDVDKGAVEPAVEAGRGAVVESSAKDPAADPKRSNAPADTSGTTYLIDDRAYAYRIPMAADVESLGYGDVDDVVVPPRWIGLFIEGVELSRDRALCPPSPDPKETDRCS